MASLHGFVLACSVCEEIASEYWQGLHSQELCHGLGLGAAGDPGRQRSANLQHAIFSVEIVSQSLALPLRLGMEIGSSPETFIKLAPLMTS